MDEIERTQQKLAEALKAFIEANEALQKLTRQDTDSAISRTLNAAKDARWKLAKAQKNFIEAHSWRLGR